MSSRLTHEIINAAIEGFESQKHKIDQQILQLRELLADGFKHGVAAPSAATAKRAVSAEARRRMALGQKRRWAAVKRQAGKSESPVGAEPARPKRRLSKAGRAAIVAASKRRWAAQSALAEKPQPDVSRTPKKVAKRKAAVKKAEAKKMAVTQAATSTAGQ